MLRGEINKGPSPRAATVYSGYDPSATWSREPIPQDSPIRQAVAETVGQVVVKNGEIYNTDFLNSTQQEWNSVANAGGDYYAALQQSYGTDTEITSNCTSSSIGLGVPGSTSKPLDEVSITSKYGYRTHPVSGKENVFHDGVDLIASEGSKVYSVADGVVVKVQEITTGYGKNIIIGHAKKDDGSYEYYTLYAHLSKIHVKEGQQVNGGQEIAASGKTGTVTGAHLHFEVRDSNNNHIDPNPTLGMSSSSSSSATSSSTGARASEDIYYNQHDYPQPFCEGYTNTYPCGMASHNDKSTVATSGCGITALAMTAATLNNDPSITPDRIASWICDDPTRKANYRIEGQGTNRAFFTASETQSEYKVTITPIDKEKPKDEIMSEVIDALKNNKMIIASLKDARLNYHMIEKHNHKDPGLEVWGTEGGHYLVLSSINEEGKIKVLDSASEQRTGYYDQSTIKTNFIGKINSGIYIVEGTGAGTGNSCSAANYSAAGDYANWKQGGDVPWGDDRLGASGTIRGVGCAATSVAIQIARSGVAVSVNPFNPGTFVDWMNKNNGFQGNNIVWQAVSGLAPNFQFVSRDNPVNNSSWSSVAKSYSDAISQGYYIIASVKNSGHWVAIDRVDGDKIYMFDPGQSQTNVMNDVYSLSGVGRFVTYKKTS